MVKTHSPDAVDLGAAENRGYRVTTAPAGTTIVRKSGEVAKGMLYRVPAADVSGIDKALPGYRRVRVKIDSHDRYAFAYVLRSME